ncbi:peptidyl-Lys metalloendopeptidase [Ceratobasidium sp. AG-Ba]|nr:peptidyl-Lys metalloendopeptidase [Ceratobasidium sp. AG-Ba]QRW14481.1 peptidyl-Lys metalloendopeptidase [Ceratobasidium sp. AG-Ba]
MSILQTYQVASTTQTAQSPFIMRSTLSSALLAALVSCAAASPALKLTVTGPSSVTDVENLMVKATLTNTGSETLKLINDPRTVLSNWKTNAFAIEGEAGSPKFTGIKVKYSPQLAAKRTDTAAFTVLAPGQSFELTHELAGFSALNVFQYVGADGDLGTISADAQSHTLAVSGKLASSKGRPVHRRGLQRRGISYNSCSSTRQSQIATAASSSNTISSGTTRWTTWFGTFSSSHFSTIKSHYANIGTDATNTEYDCTCTESDTYAYTYPDEPGYIYLCGAFWSAPNTGTDSRAGTIIHEQSHFTNNAGTQDYAYGQSAAKSLAKSNPNEAIENADNHEYFAENNPAQS